MASHLPRTSSSGGVKNSPPDRPRSRNRDEDQNSRNTGNRRDHSTLKEGRIADMYAENRLRAASSESGSAGNHDSEDIPGSKTSKVAQTSQKPETRARRFRIFHRFPHATKSAALSRLRIAASNLAPRRTRRAEGPYHSTRPS